jgi:nucleoside 2-deoxyribosyltransferase
MSGKNSLVIYFAGSIRGSREKVEDYQKILKVLLGQGTVLTEHVGSASLSTSGETNNSDEYIFTRDCSWIDASDVVIAEVSVPSLGVGYEVAYAQMKNKKVICLYQENATSKLSAMIAGNKNVLIVRYVAIDDLCHQILQLL